MFKIREISTAHGILQFRSETLTGYRCRISPERLKRGIDAAPHISRETQACPFCPKRIDSETPSFPDGNKIRIGESVSFPNLYPYAERHTVTVITKEHCPSDFTVRQLADALGGQVRSLCDFTGFHTINWNYLPSAGASLVHPHFQGLADTHPTSLPACYIRGMQRYLEREGRGYTPDLIDHERKGGRFLFGDEISWFAHAVPLGEREIRGYLPISSIDEADPYLEVLARDLLSVIHFYREFGSYAFNFSVFFDKTGMNRGFQAFCSIISRINPNPLSTSDSAFMERLHREPVIMTLPEELADVFSRRQTTP